MRKFLIITALLLPLHAPGQTDAQMSQHMFNRITYNPASTGATRYINIYGHWRDQWQGFGTDAPETMLLTAHTYFPQLKSGLGIVELSDKIGYERNILFKLSYAYHVHLNSSSYLSLGLSAGVLNRYIDWTQAVPEEYSESFVIPSVAENRWTPDFDFGIEYNMERFTVGLSVTHINKTSDNAVYYNMGHHFYGYVKYKFGLGVDFDLVPALFAQNSKKSTHIEANLILFYRNIAWAGMSYRVDDRFNSESAVGTVGIDLMGVLRLGYSFDYNVGLIGKYANNTHEIMLGIKLQKPQRLYAKTPRFFE
ncbi:MAG: type IX secretion system membrane protein PorP/SprF [Prevotellaceae bacterium]|jgi:type IX secretion system PorP/SprF family membrane protein|nr:type IX secretion system membrane protein PorP/SprF [Prevotellaceae bacterium]